MKDNEDARYKIARKMVERKKKFFTHLNTYVVFSIFFMVLNLFISPGRWWFIFPVLGWGIAIILDYIKLFGPIGFRTDAQWEKQALEEELRKLGVEPTAEESKGEDLNEKPLDLKTIEKRYEDKDLV